MRDPDDQNDEFDGRRSRPSPAAPPRATAVALAILRHPRDIFAGAAALAALATVTVNALYMQPGPHPAPIFAFKPERLPVTTADSTGALSVLPRPRPSDAVANLRAEPAPAPKPPAGRARGEIVVDIQRELLRRGWYEGAIDGVLGSRTETAIRDFEHAAGMTPTGEPSEAILKAITRSPAKPKPAAAAPRHDPIAGLLAPQKPPATAPGPQPLAAPGLQPLAAPAPRQVAAVPPPAPRPVAPPAPPPVAYTPPQPTPPAAVSGPAPVHPTPPASVPAKLPSPQVKAVQRALADYGYGQVRPTGVYDQNTQAAIESFEAARKMPVTGQISERLTRELTALTGRTIE